MSSLSELSDKYEEILNSEKKLARAVAGEVIDKPLLALWMILIPIFFVFYFFQFKRYKNGLKDFQTNFLATRTRVLDALYSELSGDAKAEIENLVTVSDLPPEVQGAYRQWIEDIMANYRLLFGAVGNSFEEMVRTGYKKRANYLLVLNKLNNSEKAFNKVLMDSMPGDKNNLAELFKKMEKTTEIYRRNQAKEVFA